MYFYLCSVYGLRSILIFPLQKLKILRGWKIYTLAFILYIYEMKYYMRCFTFRILNNYCFNSLIFFLYYRIDAIAELFFTLQNIFPLFLIIYVSLINSLFNWDISSNLIIFIKLVIVLIKSIKNFFSTLK